MVGTRRAVRVVGLDGDEIHLPVAHAPLGLRPARERAHRGGRTLEDDALETVVVVEVHVHRRDDQIVVLVLRLGEALGQLALVVVVDVRQVRDAVRLRAS